MNKFIGFREHQEQIFNNFYIDDLKLVIKLPHIGKNKEDVEVKAEKFNITRFKIFIPYE